MLHCRHVTGCTCTLLRKLFLSYCHKINDEVTISIYKKMPERKCSGIFLFKTHFFTA